MHPVLVLVIYCLLSMVASLAGGWVPLIVRLTHRRMQIAISFVSGVMLGIGLLHLLPHSLEALGSIDRTVAWVLGGFLFMFFLERFFHFHHHDVPDEEMSASETPASKHPIDAAHDHAAHDDSRGDDHGDHHDHHHDHHHGVARGEHKESPFRWGGAAIGLTLHSLVDGVALAAAVKAEEGNAAVAWAGLGAFLAIALHKPFDSLTIGTLMAAGGRSTRSRHLLNALYSLVTPLGVLLFYLFATGLDHPRDGLGEALGFAAGAFICIASSDLLPELQFHRHDRAWLSLALIAGIGLAWSTVLLEGDGHGHSHASESSPAAHLHDEHHNQDGDHD